MIPNAKDAAMLARHWGLHESPFTAANSSRFYFESPGHEEALSRMLFVIEERRPCGLLYGQSGSGKSLLLRMLARQVQRMQREVVLLDLTGRAEVELLWDLCNALGLSPSNQVNSTMLWRLLQESLSAHAAGGAPLVMLWDHAEQSRSDCLNVLQRLAPVIQQHPGISLIVACQADQLRDVPPTLRSFADLPIPLPWLNRSETADFIQHLLHAAGGDEVVFEDRAVHQLYHYTHGSPRNLLQLCDLSLLAALARQEPLVSAHTVSTVVDQWPELCDLVLDDADLVAQYD